MIAAASLQSELQTRLKKMTTGDVLSVRTWKGDRGFSLTCFADGCFASKKTAFSRSVWMISRARKC